MKTENFIMLIFVLAVLFFLINIFIIYNKRYKKDKLEREKENNRFETISSLKNKAIVTLPIGGYYRKCSITNNDIKNKKILISYSIDDKKYSPILKYDDNAFDDVETINPNLFKKESLKSLKEKLEDAVLNERYEEAERLRNEINKLKA